MVGFWREGTEALALGLVPKKSCIALTFCRFSVKMMGFLESMECELRFSSNVLSLLIELTLLTRSSFCSLLSCIILSIGKRSHDILG